MLTRIVQQISGTIMALYIQASMWVAERLLPSAKLLLASITPISKVAVYPLLLVAKTALNIKAWVVNRIIQASYSNLEPINAKHLATRLGKQPQTTVPPINQAVVTAQLQKRDKLVALTKSAQSRLKGSKIALTLTEVQLTVDGLKSQEAVRQPLQPVMPTQNQKQRHAERNKLGRFTRKGTGAVLTHTDNQ